MNIVPNLRQWQASRRRRHLLATLPKYILEDIGLYEYRGR